MDLDSQKTFSKLEDEYWWFVGRRIIIKHIRRKKSIIRNKQTKKKINSLKFKEQLDHKKNIENKK